MWREVGTPVAFFVGEQGEPFGAEVSRLDGPRYAEGYLPIVQVAYTAGETRYEQEAFVPASGLSPITGRCSSGSRRGRRPGGLQPGSAPGSRPAANGAVRDENGRTVVLYGPGWEWDAEKAELTATVGAEQTAELVVFTKPVEAPPSEFPSYDDERKACVETWTALLARGARFEVPEPIVQNAWRSLVVGNYLIAVGDRMNYSAGNAYDHLYEGECGDAVRSLMLFGHTADARRMVGPLLDFDRKATRFHVAGHKLQLLAHYYWVTRDKDYLAEKRADVGAGGRVHPRRAARPTTACCRRTATPATSTRQVYSLNSNAACWRGLRDMAAVLEDLGEKDQAADTAQGSRRVPQGRSSTRWRRASGGTASRQFIPIALLGDEQPHDPLTATRTGQLLRPDDPLRPRLRRVRPGDEREGWIIDYLRQHGGLRWG